MEPLTGNPTLANLAQYRVVNGGDLESVRQSLYDFAVYPTAGANQITLFANPIGQGQTSSTGAVAGTPKTYADTNMELASQLPRYKDFLLQSIEIIFEPGSVATANTFTKLNVSQFNAVPTQVIVAAPNDVDSIRLSGWLELNISSKNYLREAPLGRFPPKTYLSLDAAMGTNSATTATVQAQSAKFGGRPYYIDPYIVLPSNANFQITLNWPAVVATPSGFNGRIGCVLDGVLYRATQ